MECAVISIADVNCRLAADFPGNEGIIMQFLEYMGSREPIAIEPDSSPLDNSCRAGEDMLAELPSDISELEQRVVDGDGKAMTMLGDVLMFGIRGCPRDPGRACVLYAGSATAGDPYGLVAYAVLLLKILNQNFGDARAKRIIPEMTLTEDYATLISVLGKAASLGLITPLTLHVSQQAIAVGLATSGLDGADVLCAVWNEQEQKVLEAKREDFLRRRVAGELDTQVAHEYRIAGNAAFESGDLEGAVTKHYTPGIRWIQSLLSKRREDCMVHLVKLLANRVEAYLRLGSHQWACMDLDTLEELLRRYPKLKLPRNFRSKVNDRRRRATEANAAEACRGAAAEACGNVPTNQATGERGQQCDERSFPSTSMCVPDKVIECSLCLVEAGDEEDLEAGPWRQTISCKHWFHVVCLKEVIKSKYRQQSKHSDIKHECPFCRSQLDPTDFE